MAQGIGEVLTYAIAVSISFLAIIAVIRMLLSPRAIVNGPAFLAGWVVALSVVISVAYVALHQTDFATSTNSTGLSWGRVVFGAVLLLLAARDWLQRAAPGAEPELPKWMASADTVAPTRAFGLGAVMAGVSPKNLILTVAVAAALAELSLSRTDAVGSLIVFVIVASLTIAGPIGYRFGRGERSLAALESLKDRLAVHNAAVTLVVLVVLGVDLIAWGFPPLAARYL